MTVSVMCLLLTLSCGGDRDRAGEAARDRLLALYVGILQDDAAAPRTAAAAVTDSVRFALDAETIRTAVRYLNQRPERWNRFFKAAERELGAVAPPADTAGISTLFRRTMINRSSAAAPR